MKAAAKSTNLGNGVGNGSGVSISNLHNLAIGLEPVGSELLAFPEVSNLSVTQLTEEKEHSNPNHKKEVATLTSTRWLTRQNI